MSHIILPKWRYGFRFQKISCDTMIRRFELRVSCHNNFFTGVSNVFRYKSINFVRQLNRNNARATIMYIVWFLLDFGMPLVCICSEIQSYLLHCGSPVGPTDHAPYGSKKSGDGSHHWCILLEASFGLRVLSLTASVCVRWPLACPRDNLSRVQARITKFGPQEQNTFVKIPTVLGGNWPWTSRSNLT